jgi:shikimate 5-dehydrogenase
MLPAHNRTYRPCPTHLRRHNDLLHWHDDRAVAIMKVFPRWAAALKLNAVIKGIDFVPDQGAPRYREAVRFIKGDPLSLGALVTTHKVNLLKASRDLFDELDPYAKTLGEISSISKRHGRLCGHAKDPITVGRALEAIVDEGYWCRTGGELLNLGPADRRWP